MMMANLKPKKKKKTLSNKGKAQSTDDNRTKPEIKLIYSVGKVRMNSSTINAWLTNCNVVILECVFIMVESRERDGFSYHWLRETFPNLACVHRK
jgi:hypothetical protein